MWWPSHSELVVDPSAPCTPLKRQLMSKHAQDPPLVSSGRGKNGKTNTKGPRLLTRIPHTMVNTPSQMELKRMNSPTMMSDNGISGYNKNSQRRVEGANIYIRALGGIPRFSKSQMLPKMLQGAVNQPTGTSIARQPTYNPSIRKGPLKGRGSGISIGTVASLKKAAGCKMMRLKNPLKHDAITQRKLANDSGPWLHGSRVEKS